MVCLFGLLPLLYSVLTHPWNTVAKPSFSPLISHAACGRLKKLYEDLGRTGTQKQQNIEQQIKPRPIPVIKNCPPVNSCSPGTIVPCRTLSPPLLLFWPAPTTPCLPDWFRNPKYTSFHCREHFSFLFSLSTFAWTELIIMCVSMCVCVC